MLLIREKYIKVKLAGETNAMEGRIEFKIYF
jgi:hypothetical protein